MAKAFIPLRVYYESGTEDYPLGRELLDRYAKDGIPLIEIDNHNRIDELRNRPDEDFTEMKKYLILGIRKSLRLIPNERSADYIVPFTSSGCSAMCKYCYLVCTFFKNAYLRVFVNRDQMMTEVRKKAEKIGKPTVFEIGSNSDMILENTITGNLNWAIEEFSKIDNATATLATKFSMVRPLLALEHKGHTQIRFSINPQELIRRVEIGTSSLPERLDAANQLFAAGYRIGINIAPIILVPRWQEMYLEMFDELDAVLYLGLKRNVFFELIFMTYGAANDIINQAALPGTMEIFDRELMRPKGRGKYCYRPAVREESEAFFRDQIGHRFPYAEIRYIV